MCLHMCVMCCVLYPNVFAYVCDVMCSVPYVSAYVCDVLCSVP